MARTTFSGPVSGAYVSYPVHVVTGANATTYTADMELPAGMQVTWYSATVRATAVTSDPSLIIGNSTDPNGYKVAVNVTTNLGELTLDGALVTGGRAESSVAGRLIVEVTNDAGDAFTDLDVVVHGYVTAHATNTPAR